MTPRAACPTPVVYSPEYECDIGRHVFPTEKFRLVRDGLIAAGLIAAGDVIVPEPAPREDLLLVHTAEYLDDLDALRWTPRTRRGVASGPDAHPRLCRPCRQQGPPYRRPAARRHTLVARHLGLRRSPKAGDLHTAARRAPVQAAARRPASSRPPV